MKGKKGKTKTTTFLNLCMFSASMAAAERLVFSLHTSADFFPGSTSAPLLLAPCALLL